MNPVLNKEAYLKDYRIAYISRLTSLKGRKEVLGGRAKFGIFGDGKEVAQVAMAHFVRPGDWRSGYYRDQTLMFALGQSTVRQFFAQLYADTDIIREPASGGRQMNCHFGSRFLNERGEWLDQLKQFNTSSDISPTGGQMTRLLGLAYASKLYRECTPMTRFPDSAKFSHQGNEIAFGTIGNASTSEGLFWESFNAAGVLQVPFLISIWDDDYGISVPNKFQTTKESIYECLKGFASSGEKIGYQLMQVKGHDYPGLMETYAKATQICRELHRPTAVHVWEMTQPQGHSTSGSHERYKSSERLKFEETWDCLRQMRIWLEKDQKVSPKELDAIEKDAQDHVEVEQQAAWENYQKDLLKERDDLLGVYSELGATTQLDIFPKAAEDLKKVGVLLKRNLAKSMTHVLLELRLHPKVRKDALLNFWDQYHRQRHGEYNSHLYCRPERSPLNKKPVAPSYTEASPKVDGRQVIQKFFDVSLGKDPRLFIIGEDIGKLGGVNLEFEGLNEKYGEHRVSDTGIREATILGQGIGAALRGLRPVVDIQYLDYLAYCLQGLTDDLATVHYRSAGGQAAPVIVRTKGHRLEGIWHTGSPIGMILGSIRGMHFCVPRNCVQASGMYQTLLAGDDPGLVIEVLNGYRVKEVMPDNVGDYSVPLGVCEVLQGGEDLTIVTYGANCRIAMEAVPLLKKLGISPEVIDVQTLLPFDVGHSIRESLAKTNMLLVFDEDVPGGASAYILQKVLEEQNGYDHLDAPPQTLCAKEHRSAYGSDGDHFSKPQLEDLILKVYGMMRERDPENFPDIF